MLTAQIEPATRAPESGICGRKDWARAEQVTHLFVDEAHHIGAHTWRDFKAYFSKKPVLQFTATPFRNDGRHIDGKFIYVYPLRKAQEDRLFRPIRYLPVHGLDDDNTDDLIVGKVGEQIESDLRAGFDHLVMARTSRVDRAIALHQKYAARLPQHAPQLIHNKMTASSRSTALAALQARTSRIIVCVDMLGEGFDLPDLKIAALHDKHRSEAVTLQFIGRFTRARSDLGDATVIANVTVDDVNERLKALYAEDADWNRLLNVIGHSRIERERKREDLFSGFSDQPDQFPLETFEPRMSAVVYKTMCPAWRPEGVAEAVSSGSTIVEGPFVNPEGRLVVFVTRDHERLRWTRIRQPQNIEYNMFMLHWDDDTNLLYINSSRLGDLHTELAKKVAGDDVVRISGEPVFRVLHGFRRLVLMNLGLSETQRKPVRYSQFMGSDIADQLDTLPGNRSRTKTNLFGQGFTDVEDSDEEGNVLNTYAAKETIGCSTKGKIWSYQVTNSFAEWIEWCHGIGRKLLNESITNDAILRHVVRPKRQDNRPDGKVPIAIAWPERFLHDVEDRIEIEVGGVRLPFFDCEIEISAYTDSGPIRFNSGEVADVVAVRRSGRALKVDLFHCKYSTEDKAGARVIDLYEVCGQAQKSVRWAERHDEFLKHLMRREADRQKKGQPTRYEKGNSQVLYALINQWRELRPEFSVTIVQPGYSKAQADKAHLELLAATESFLMETWRIR
jgi:Helicase conserved C-terminal domain/Type III restriction enzyme, res subunit